MYTLKVSLLYWLSAYLCPSLRLRGNSLRSSQVELDVYLESEFALLALRLLVSLSKTANILFLGNLFKGNSLRSSQVGLDVYLERNLFKGNSLRSSQVELDVYLERNLFKGNSLRSSQVELDVYLEISTSCVFLNAYFRTKFLNAYRPAISFRAHNQYFVVPKSPEV
ncbi:uncharacterized protein BX663DRAFT_488557 [Cokeromyces recurvatus]|uniref:uncharacterized protein n=1 Tax=Cokeromyces recurvatus TaxID=90255 RepID=UPI00221ED919|nr:uncharacterized protein BX663DRAFT_488557 [Cokeromyces recurvatus]KAI7900360.1 hypothetical protein BX663DRAFT_488557 [Cokeromyces recurvatus]